jgi:metal-sulfur cluster biosynthetic enzyme
MNQNLSSPNTPEEKTLLQQIEEQLQTVYDPEFPVVDIWTLGLVYKVELHDDSQIVAILMTFTTPACPMGEMIEQMVENAVHEILPTRQVKITITFDPMRSPSMIKDEDLQRMFE